MLVCACLCPNAYVLTRRSLPPQGSTGRGGAPHQQWRRILWSSRDTFRIQIGRLLVHTLSPAQPLADRKEALDFVFDPRHGDILRESLSPGLEVSGAGALGLPPLKPRGWRAAVGGNSNVEV